MEPSADQVQPGAVLAGKYRVERVLGSGGMGVVVAARHLHLDERVAIKFLLPQAMARGEVIARFLREGRAAARIKSEHVARVFDVGTLESGAPYLVMEYLDGADFGVWLRARGALPAAEAIDFGLQVCEALADAHALGVIHRDLKPGNLFLTRKSDGSPSLKLIDFGISKLTGPTPEGEVEVTASAVMMGSPLFMAPEQMKSARDVDARADIWSLGCLLYLMLTGRPPFPGTTVMGIYDLILQGVPPLDIVPNIPIPVAAAVERCLSTNAGARFGDVAELAAVLAPFGSRGAVDRAERIARIVAVAGRPAHVNAVTEVTRESVFRPPNESSSTAPAAHGEPEPARSGTDTGTDGPWNATGAPVRKGRGLVMFAMAAGLVAAIAAALGFRAIQRPHAVEGIDAGSSVASAPIAEATATAAVSAAPAPEVAPSAATPAPEASSSSPPRPPSHSSSRPRGVPPKPARDLFGDPR